MPGTSTLLLDLNNWDLVQDAKGNIAVASTPYSLAQDAASAIKTFRGEVYWDTTIGVPYMEQVLGQRPSLALMKELFCAAAKTVPAVGSAQCFLTGFADRRITGQVQVTEKASGVVAAVNFTVFDPQGA